MPLPHGWMATGRLWNSHFSTYNGVSPHLLPPVVPDESFAYLRAPPADAAAPAASNGHAGGGANGHTNGDDDDDDDKVEWAISFSRSGHLEALAALDERAAEAAALGLALPASFTAFIRDRTLPHRFPSYSACYLSLGDALLPVPGADPRARALRFLNDQQFCVLWYLLLEPGVPARIIFACPEFPNEDDDEDEDEDGSEAGGEAASGRRGAADTAADAGVNAEGYRLRETTICAESFPEFIKRLWIESLAEFGGRDEPEIAAYIAAAKRNCEADAAAPAAEQTASGA